MEKRLVKEQTAPCPPTGSRPRLGGEGDWEQRSGQSGQGLQTDSAPDAEQGQPRQAPGAVPEGERQAGPHWELLGSRESSGQREGRALRSCRRVHAPPQGWRRVSWRRGQWEPGAETGPSRQADQSLRSQDSPCSSAGPERGQGQKARSLPPSPVPGLHGLPPAPETHTTPSSTSCRVLQHWTQPSGSLTMSLPLLQLTSPQSQDSGSKFTGTLSGA